MWLYKPWQYKTLHVTHFIGEAATDLTFFVKFLFWLGLTILVYSLVSIVLFPTEFLLIPATIWG